MSDGEFSRAAWLSSDRGPLTRRCVTVMPLGDRRDKGRGSVWPLGKGRGVDGLGVDMADTGNQPGRALVLPLIREGVAPAMSEVAR